MFWYLIYSFAIPVILRWMKLLYFLRPEETMWFLKLGIKAKLDITCFLTVLVVMLRSCPSLARIIPFFRAVCVPLSR